MSDLDQEVAVPRRGHLHLRQLPSLPHARATSRATWVRNQLAAGWHLMPITLGPQASCSTRYPRYGKSIDPTINPSIDQHLPRGPVPGRAEARRAVAAAQQPRHRPGQHALLRPRGVRHPQSTACTQSALWFLTAWTTAAAPTYGYASGYYSSAASGHQDARRPAGPVGQPDRDARPDLDRGLERRANTSSSYIRSDGWQPYRRAKQYQGGHNETWGGVTDQHRPQLPQTCAPRSSPASSTPAPTPTPAPAAAPARRSYTGNSMRDPRCTPATITRRTTGHEHARWPTSMIVPLQCLLKQQRLYPYEVTGKWNTQTRCGAARLPAAGHGSARASSSQPTGSACSSPATAAPLSRRVECAAPTSRGVQRAMNAALARGCAVTGIYRPATTASASAPTSAGRRQRHPRWSDLAARGTAPDVAGAMRGSGALEGATRW